MATVTITTPPAQDLRIIVAFGSRLQTRDASGARRDATVAEIKADIIRYVTQIVSEEEKKAARIAADSGVVDVTPA